MSAQPLRLAFGNAAADYDRGRPGWPDEIAEVGGLSPEADVVDLAAGTGKLTSVLARRFAHVTAIEPDDSMLALIPQGTNCVALSGSAEGIPLTDSSVDGVFCAEAFHWFEWRLALREISRVLRPRGVLVLCFNVADGDAYIPLPNTAKEILERYRRPGIGPGGKILESGAWQEPFAEFHSPFEPLRNESFRHVHVQDADAVVARTLSTSIFASLTPEERRALGNELRAVVQEGTYETPLCAEVWSTRLK